MSELREQIQNVIENEDVAIFMKGTPQFVMCGNSGRALEALRRAGAPVTVVDILPDPRYRQELSALSNWPTIPQVFVRGELLGGADIVEELAQSGELERTLEEKLGADYRRSDSPSCTSRWQPRRRGRRSVPRTCCVARRCGRRRRPRRAGRGRG
jgi:monothiol glutaredoxin